MVSGAGGSARNCSTFGVRGSRETSEAANVLFASPLALFRSFARSRVPLATPLCSSHSRALAVPLAAEVHDDGAGEDQDVVLGVGDLDGVGFRGLVPAAGDGGHRVALAA